jgi:hypothetical protein
MIVEVVADLLTPVLPPRAGFMPGDALLHAAAVRRAFPDTWALRRPAVWEPIPLPLAQRDGCYLASCVLLPDAAFSLSSLSKSADTPVLGGRLRKDNGTPVLKPPNHLQYLYKLGIAHFPTLHAPQFRVLFEVPDDDGALEDLADLLSYWPSLSLGTHRHLGYGRVGAIRHFGRADAASAVLTADGTPLRPLPAAWFDTPPPDAVLRRARLSPPYWIGPEVAAYCPRPAVLYGQEASHGYVLA